MHRLALQTILALLLASPALAQWTPAVRISDEATTFNPKIVANGDSLHVVYWIWNGHAESYYLRSIDSGTTWGNPFRLGDSGFSSGEDSPLIRIDGNTLNCIWWQSLPGGGQYNYGFRCSFDGGDNWGDVFYILPSNNYELHSHTFSISNSQVFLIYNRTSNQEKVIEFTKSTDWGQTWTSPTQLFRAEQTGQFDMVARGDTIHFTWTGRFYFGDKVDIYYMKSEDGGESWTDNLLISTDDNWHSQQPSISMNEAGDLAICWMDYKYSPNFYAGDILARYSYDSGDNWSSEQQLTFIHETLSPRVVWQSDSIHVCWEDYRNGIDPYYMLSTDNGLTWEEEQHVDDDPSFSEFPDIAVSGDDRYVVWSDRRAEPGHGVYFSKWDHEVGIEEEDFLPSEIALTAYPNPFNGNTTIAYNLSEGGEIEIYNITGQRIRTLNFPTKEGKIIWDARDALGNKVSSGIYFARARAPQKSNTLKLLYLK